MGEQDVFAEALPAARYDRVQRDSAQRAAKRQHLARKSEPDQPRPRLDYSQSEAPREVVGEAARAQLGNRKPAGRDHQRRPDKPATFGLDTETVGAINGGYSITGPQIDGGRGTFREQHRQNLAGGAVAEELAQGFFVIADAMPLDHRDKVAFGVAAQRRPAKIRVSGEKALGCDLEIGEIAAAAAGDQNFFSRIRVMFEQQDAPPTPPR